MVRSCLGCREVMRRERGGEWRYRNTDEVISNTTSQAQHYQRRTSGHGNTALCSMPSPGDMLQVETIGMRPITESDHMPVYEQYLNIRLRLMRTAWIERLRLFVFT